MKKITNRRMPPNKKKNQFNLTFLYLPLVYTHYGFFLNLVISDSVIERYYVLNISHSAKQNLNILKNEKKYFNFNFLLI